MCIRDRCKIKHNEEDQWKCFLVPYAINYIKTPLFITNSLFDIYQHYRFMVLQCNPTPEAQHGVCNPRQISYMNNYRDDMVELLEKYLEAHPTSGAWAVSCWVHPVKNHDFYWNVVKVGDGTKKKTLKEVFLSWYKEDGDSKVAKKFIRIDGKWGSNSCHAS